MARQVVRVLDIISVRLDTSSDIRQNDVAAIESLCVEFESELDQLSVQRARLDEILAALRRRVLSNTRPKSAANEPYRL
jgi:hypothetical protein